jgi:predicted naringenin-chalcone synthase
MYLSDFRSAPPPYRESQERALTWLSEAHARSGGDSERMFKLLKRYGCSPDKISERGSFLRDFDHRNWDQMQLFAGAKAAIDDRLKIFREVLWQPVEKLYPSITADFQTWIHVSCTGYVSPSVIQTLASQREWGSQVTCLHAYHMGCYAAFPALRMARGNGETEILHTELCTLHFDPSSHDPDQLVIQSLFADGVIRYRASEQQPLSGYEVVELREIIAPGSLDQMGWDVASGGFRMRLAREVPKYIEQGVLQVVKPWMTKDAVFAIHPGGPRIIDAVKDALELSEEQVFFSREVLRLHGNMSSATLPHVWMKMQDQIAKGTPVISMAFGPGLTISSGIMKKV